MHMDGAVLTDEKGHALTKSGGVARSATQSKFGGYSVYFDGVDDEISNTSDIYQIYSNYQCGELFCRPVSQLDTNPCVLRLRNFKLEYKPAGYPYGFVMNVNGTRTACGIHPENEWHFIWFTIYYDELSLYINGQFVATFDSYYYDGAPGFTLGSALLGTSPDTAFAGYVDDFRLTDRAAAEIDGEILRTDFSVPTSAFLNRLPDPEGGAVGSMAFTGTGAGIVAPVGAASSALSIVAEGEGYVAPIGVVSGNISFSGAGVASISQAGPVAGAIRFTGLGAGVIGITGQGLGRLAFTGSALGSRGVFGQASCRLRFTGSAVGKHGTSGEVSGSLRFDALAIGTTPIVPIGQALGSLRFSGNAYGTGGVTSHQCH